jgi:hypothetical protein
MSTTQQKTVLSQKSVHAIASQVEAQLKQSAIPPSSPNGDSHLEDMLHRSKKSFLLGAASTLALVAVAPLFSKQARPAVRGAIKGGLLAGRYFQRVASTIKEDVQDLTEEAKAELDQEQETAEAGTRKTSTERPE